MPATHALTLLRHGQSDPLPGGRDFERPLTEEGRRFLEKQAGALALLHPPIDYVLCSGAKRTQETFKIIQPAMNDTVSVNFDDDLFLARPTYLIRCLESLDDHYLHPLVIGHGPTLQGFLNWLQGIQGNTLHFDAGSFVHVKLSIACWRNIAPFTIT